MAFRVQGSCSRNKAAPEDPSRVYTEDELHAYAAASPPELISAESSFKSDFKLTGEVLGVGMGGCVMTATCRASGQKVAVKSFKLSKLSKRQKLDLDREIQTQFSVDHPHVGRVEAVYTSETHLRLVMELLEGGDVFEHLDECGSISERQTALVMQQLLEAVAHLHEMGIVHRDIKLENLVYESKRRDKVKLIDFGLCSHWAEGQKPLMRACGTLAYIPPEMKKGGYTNKVDLWCVGTAAYTMLTGEKLLRDEAMGPIYSQTFARCSKGAQRFVMMLLNPDPAARPTALEALEHRWLRDAVVRSHCAEKRVAGNDRLDTIYQGSSESTRSPFWGPEYSVACSALDLSFSANFCRHMLSRNSTDDELCQAVESMPAGLYRQQMKNDIFASECTAKPSFWRNPMKTMTLGGRRVSKLVGSLRPSLRSQTKGTTRIAPEIEVMPANRKANSR